MKWNLTQLLEKQHAYTPKAKALLQDKEKSKELLANVSTKASDNKGKLAEIWSDLQLMVNILRDWRKGTYKQLPKKSLLMIAATFLYFLSPIDFVPDFLPGGLLDDVALIGFTFTQIQSDVAAYKEWKNQQPIKTTSIDIS
ncbi:Uncharacterized membrane protein YkvA, DUF1232 family [Terribacillus aidingensis]|uniref:Uncharacterized membrane protein YkvA, DUF1232 family n=1 Tax=Terribacillus aidingensis TaxID=586416 RepID=A0A285P3P4_9BACI|nr:YkvA family protein [Terribacillus aidingensis]SNZ16350.1 Uncharacterized membrane protein YkvA, DUF1232 family [Terribacillus aidingensis]